MAKQYINLYQLAREHTELMVGKDFDKALLEEMETIAVLLVDHATWHAQQNERNDPPRRTIMERDLLHASDAVKLAIGYSRGD